MFVGDGAGRDALLSLARELGVAERVVLAGFHPDPTPFYKTADLFVLSSDYEGFGNVIVEAMACGTPVVSTDCPSGPGEILDGGRYGRLVPVGDVGSMTNAIEAALDDKIPEEALRNRASDFKPERAASAYLSLMDLK
jgi:glycosyltransferase involved in cell wall biosynthesis